MNAQTQTIVVDTTMTTDCYISPFQNVDTIYSLKLTGSVVLNSDTSLVRVIVSNEYGQELMLYETYRLISEESTFNISNKCDETCYLEGFVPITLEIQLINASLTISSLSYDINENNQAYNLQKSIKITLELNKAHAIQDFIDQNKMLWFADTNSISMLSYSAKKQLFGDKYNSLGLDYYCGGLYFPIGAELGTVDQSNLIENWDWRNRHGATDPAKGEYYFDPNSDGNGWMTSIKDQTDRAGCTGLCYIYSPIGAVEGLANLYLNNPIHVNYNLSEEHVLDCDNYNNPEQCLWGYASNTNYFIKNHGVLDEECYEMDDEPGVCIQNPCNDPNKKISFESWDYVGEDEEYPEIIEIKTKLIEKGPMNAWIEAYIGSGNHFMTLIGYGKIKVGDIYHDPDSGFIEITVEEGSPFIGHTYWKFKNSWGSNWGDNGYMYHINTQVSPAWISFYELPRDNILTPEVEEPLCLDKDNDGYFNWGVQHAPPLVCREISPLDKDSDDSNPRLGPFDENYYSIPVAPLMEVKDENNKVIPHNSIYSFYDDDLNVNEQITLSFKIENNGNAKLNLRPNSLGTTITINDEYEGEDFEVSYPQNFKTEILMEGDYTTFYITFTLKTPINEAKRAEVIIHLNEVDMETYQFTLVFADCAQDPTPSYITSTQTWPGLYTFIGDVTVMSPAVLTVTGTAAFSAGSSLFIEQGAQVIIDGGELTSLCNEPWEGVDVWGQSNLTQLLTSNQGYIRIINGGKISNAKIGIETIKYERGEPVRTSSGGIISMNDGSIINCETGIKFYEYTNFYLDPNNVLPNISYFTNVHFYNDKNQVPLAQLYLTRVNGIEIKGCTFEHTTPSYISNTVGIFSENSGFRVTYENLSPQIDPPTEIRQSVFRNLDYGIKCLNTPVYGKVTVSYTLFEDNVYGVYTNLTDFSEIFKNEFNVRSRFSKQNNSGYVGLYIQNQSRSIIIEENKFYCELRGLELITENCQGICMFNSGEYPNEIYNNIFNSLSIGVIAMGSNRDEQGAGLCIKCNDFGDCINDVYVTGEGGTGNLGIARKQGDVNNQGGSDPTLAAGNTFSKIDNENYVSYFKTLSCGEIVYTHQSATPQDPQHIVPFPRENIIVQGDENASYSKETSCPSNYGGGGIELMATTISYSSELVAADAYLDTLTALVDGGDSEDLTFEVSTSTPDETLELRQNLLGKSPYLSDTVMKSAINKEDVLPNAFLRDVLVANPQSAKSAKVLQQLDDRVNPMPAYMMDQIMLGKNIYGAKELLEQHFASHKTNKGKAMTKLIKYYTNDTTDFSASYDSIIGILASDNELQSRYLLVLKHLGQNDSTGTYNTYNGIPTEFDLNNSQETEYDLFGSLIELYLQMENDTTLSDSVAIDALFDIEQYQNTLPGMYATNMLIGLGELEYEPPIFVPNFNKSASIDLPAWPDHTEKHDNLMKLFPNPAGEYFTVEYDLEDFQGKYNLAVFTINGVMMKNIELQLNHDQVVIITGNYSPGIYIVEMVVNGEIIETQKLVLIK